MGAAVKGFTKQLNEYLDAIMGPEEWAWKLILNPAILFPEFLKKIASKYV